MSLDVLSAVLGYTFNNSDILEKALTHRSLKVDHNERLEFLGDSVLGMVISTDLFTRYPDASEGQLSYMRSVLVCQDSLVEIAEEFDLTHHIRLGASEKGISRSRRPALLADVVEAIIGAIYMDGGWLACESCVLGWYKSRLERVQYVQSTKDAKSTLQEYLQAAGQALPSYQVISQTGSSHSPTFTVRCALEANETSTMVSCSGFGKSKREAEQQAASKLLALLKQKK